MTTTKKFPTRAEMDQFARSQNERFDIAALRVTMKNHAKAVIEEDPPIDTSTATSRGRKLPGIATLARCVLAHCDQVGSCIEQDDPAGAAAHAIQLDRAYHAMVHYRLRPATLYGIDHMFQWRWEYIDATEIPRKILACIGERNRVPIRELLEVTGANRGTLGTQLNRANKCIERLGCVLQMREEFVNVTYTGL